MKKILILFIFYSLNTFAQNEPDYFIRNGDTTFSKNISYKLNGQSYLKRLTYVTSDGKSIELEGKKKLKDISSFKIDGTIIDKIPQRTSNPDKYVFWAERVVDGKLNVIYYNSSITTTNVGGDINNGYHTANSTILRFYVQMPDGTFYSIRKSSHRKKYIIPYLKQCAAFNEAYKGDFSYDMNFYENYEKFIKIFSLYNSLCK